MNNLLQYLNHNGVLYLRLELVIQHTVQEFKN